MGADAAVTIKGTKDGLVIALGDGPLEEVLEELEKRLTSKASFFLGGRVALRAGDRVLSTDQLRAIGATMEQAGVTLWAIESAQPETHVAARELGLETSMQGVAVESSVPSAQSQVSREELPGIVVRRTVRAGQELHYPGHITLIGDVNPGAEVIAGGDVLVWGKLRGAVYAGVLEDDGAVVCALQLAPSQIRIGSHIAQPPERARPPKQAEMASVHEGTIVVERWERK